VKEATHSLNSWARWSYYWGHNAMSDPFDWWPPNGPFPPFTTGIRGPDNRNLTDLHNAMVGGVSPEVSLLQSMESIRLSVQRQEVLLERLVGVPGDQPASWLGLPNYLSNTIGLPQSTDSTRVRQLLASVDGWMGVFFNMLNDNGITPGGGGAWQQAAASLATIDASTSAAATAIAAVQLVLGAIEHDPTGSTLKDLLRSIDANVLRSAICCEEGLPPVEPPANEQNAEPLEVSCDPTDYPYLRNSGWVAITPPLLDNQPGLTGWAPTFANVNSHFDGDLQVDAPAGGSGILFSTFLNINSAYDACFKWDFTDNVVPQLATFYRFGSGDFYSGGETSGSISPLNVPVGGFIRAMDAGIRFLPVFYTEEGAGPPGLNLWMTVVFGAS
jgi:hypothetical protein